LKKTPPARPLASNYPQLTLKVDRPSRDVVHAVRSVGRALTQFRPPSTIVVPAGVYQHYKGKFYLVTECTIDVDSQELVVGYQALYQDDRNPDYTAFTQKLTRFLEEVEGINDETKTRVPRFQLVDPGTQ
jgi:hypothetical protein